MDTSQYLVIFFQILGSLALLIFVIIGTSLNVYPAAGLIAYTKPNIPIYLIDPGAVNTNDYYKIEHIMKGASEGMKQLKEILEK